MQLDIKCVLRPVGGSHEAILKTAGALVGQVKAMEPLPKGLVLEFVTVDDHVGIQVQSAHAPLENHSCASLFSRCMYAYSEHEGLHVNDGKTQWNCARGVVLGAEVDGDRGL
eukprot:4917244-Amphidinium_carterae.1